MPPTPLTTYPKPSLFELIDQLKAFAIQHGDMPVSVMFYEMEFSTRCKCYDLAEKAANYLVGIQRYDVQGKEDDATPFCEIHVTNSKKALPFESPLGHPEPWDSKSIEQR